nr:response regulator transcription factor [Coralloluteibacterium stylophorae]
MVVDDHTLVRAGIRRLLESFSGVEVVGEGASAEDALALTAARQPDLVLLDLSMPGRSGLDVLGDLRLRHPGVAVVIMSMHDDANRVREALDRGAAGFVVKEAAVAELEVALRAAMAGQTYLSPQIASQMVGSLLGRERRTGVAALSPRQRDILGRIGRGQTTKQIAADLELSVKTVETHRARMMETLGVRRANDLLRFAVGYQQSLD